MDVLSLGISRILKSAYEVISATRIEKSPLYVVAALKALSELENRYFTPSIYFFSPLPVHLEWEWTSILPENPTAIYRLSELSTESGLTGMLQAKDFESIDKISPLLGALFDSYCAQSSGADITRTFKKYLNLIRASRKVNVPKWWAKRDLQMLTDMINDFKDRGFETFGNH